MSNRIYEAKGHLVDKDGVRREIKAVNKIWIDLQACDISIPVWAADCMEYEPPKRDEWLTEKDREAFMASKMPATATAFYNQLLTDRLGKPSEWVRKRDVARAIWESDGPLNWKMVKRLADIGLTAELAKEARDE